MVSKLYVAEGSMENIDLPDPSGKIALLVTGKGVFTGALEYVMNTMINNGYERIIHLGKHTQSPLGPYVTSERFAQSNFEGVVGDLSVTESDRIFIGFLGLPIVSDGDRYSLPTPSGASYPLVDLERTLASLPAQKITHYISSSQNAGEVARRLALLEHPEVATHRVSVGSHQPKTGYVLEYGNLVPQAKRLCSNPFDEGFFIPETVKTIDDRLRSAVSLQRGKGGKRNHTGYLGSSVCPTTFRL